MATSREPVSKSWAQLGRRLQKSLDRLGDQTFDVIDETFDDFGRTWVHSMEAKSRGQYSAGPKGASDPLAVRSGELRRSFGHVVVRQGPREVLLRMFNTARHALVHELGTKGAGGEMDDIVPKKAKALTIPLEAALTASGRAKGGRSRADQWDDLFLFKFPVRGDRDEAFLARETGSGDIELIFRLADKVSIPPRLGGRAMMRSLTQTRLIPTMNRLLDEALRG